MGGVGPCAGLIGVAQLYLGAQRLTDVLGTLALGTVCLFALLAAAPPSAPWALRPRRPDHPSLGPHRRGRGTWMACRAGIGPSG